MQNAMTVRLMPAFVLWRLSLSFLDGIHFIDAVSAQVAGRRSRRWCPAVRRALPVAAAVGVGACRRRSRR